MSNRHADDRGRDAQNQTSQGASDMRGHGTQNQTGRGMRARWEDIRRSQLQGPATFDTMD